MFDLEAHETACDPDASWFKAGSEALNHAQKWRVAIENRGQSKFGRVLFKRENQPLLVASVAEKSPFRSYALGEKFLDSSVGARGLRMTLADCLSNQKWARPLFLNEHLKPRQSGELARFEVFLSPHGWGLWRKLSWSQPPLYEFQQAEFAFPAIPADELAHVEAKDLRSRLFCQNEETADVRFAREFLTLSPDEQTAHLWSWKRGDLAGLQSVLRLAILAQDELWSEPRTLTWEVDLSGEMGPQIAGGQLREGRHRTPSKVPTSMKEALEQVRRWFGLQIHHEAHQRHLCLSRLFDTKIQKMALSPSIEVREPTAHERLEAMLEWREWLEETGAGHKG